MIHAVLFDVDFTLIQPGPMFRAEGYEAFCARYGSGSSSRQACTLMTESKTTIALEGGCPAYLFANAGGRGYYVPDYRGNLLAKLAAQRSALTVAEYASLVGDIRALVRAGSMSASRAIEWLRIAGRAHDRHIVLAAIGLWQRFQKLQ